MNPTPGKIAIIIPAFNPDERLTRLILALRALNFDKIVVVDDGSDASCEPVFSQLLLLNCPVVRHKVNQGKGAALKSGIRYTIARFPELAGIVTADADGQHLPEDIARLCDAIPFHPNAILLGVRDFSLPDIPLRSRLGNRITSLVFYLTTKIRCPDTQTGLRAIPRKLCDFALSIPGERYEYEMNLLTQCGKEGLPIIQLPISTVYLDKNATSHFRPVKDSARIYQNFIKFGVSSLLSAGTDLSLFALFAYLIFGQSTAGILASTVAARCLSGALNFTLNKKWCFASRGRYVNQALKYGILFGAQMLLSWSMVSFFCLYFPQLLAVKVVTDCTLFFFSFIIQRKVVFRDPNPHKQS